MIRPIPHRMSIDSSGRYHGPSSVCDERVRTIKIRYRPVLDGGYEVHAWGSELPETGSSANIGHLRADRQQISGWISDFYETWHKEVVDWRDTKDPHPDAMHRLPFADEVDVRKINSLGEMWHKVALAGRQLFWQLFNEGDAGLRALGERLTEVLWEGEHVITVISDDVVAPWSMLYIPTPDTPSEMDGRFAVDRSAFLGYRHLVEHTFEVHRKSKPGIRFTELSTAAYFDEAFDHHDHRAPIVRPVLDMLNRHSVVRTGTSRAVLSSLLRADGASDHLIYFCCHCVEEPPSAARLQLTNGDRVSSGDLGYWLGNTGLLNSPFVVVNACQAGDFGAHSASHFGRVLLVKGASCLLGPCVNIPAVFAGAFAEELFDLVLASRHPFGEAVRALTRHYTDQCGNPLGLSYSLYQGIDGHFCQVEVPGAVSAADG